MMKTKKYMERRNNLRNNSPDQLSYLWIQLDQNIEERCSVRKMDKVEPILRVETFVNTYFKEPFDGRLNIDWVKDANGSPLKHTINMTMMRGRIYLIL